MDAEKLLQHYLKATEIEQGGAWHWVDQHIEVAFLSVATMKNRPEDARISGTVPLHEFTNRASMKG